jgi:hypothetical protein
MRTRKREIDITTGMVQLAALVAVGCAISPLLRSCVVWAGIALLLAGVGFVAYRVVIRSKARPVGWNVQADCKASEVASRANGLRDQCTSPPELTERLRTTDCGIAGHSPERPSGVAPANPAELRAQLHSIDWFQFEKLVALVYRKLGYTVARRGGANPDGGIDLVIEKDGQRSDVQCKQWKKWNVRVKDVREFLGALTDARMQKGVFITLRGYTGAAKQLADKHGIEIVNETGLVNLLESADARYDPEMLAILNDTTKYCPKCEGVMVLRTAAKGPNPGSQFWGCSNYPKCRSTMPVS